MGGSIGHSTADASKASAGGTPPKTDGAGAGAGALAGAGAGIGTGAMSAAETDASMSTMMATMAHNTIIGNLASIAESNNNLLVNGTGGITKVTSNVGRNLKDAAG